MRLFWLLTFLQAIQVYGSILKGHYEAAESYKAEIDPRRALDLNLDNSIITKRGPRSLCVAPTLNSQTPKLPPRFFEHNALNSTGPKLEARTMSLPKISMKAFYKRELGHEAFNDVVFESGGSDVCTSLFEELKDVPISLGTEGLCGCTALVIVSRTGLFMGHYWENIAFTPDEEYTLKGETPDDVFERTVIKGLVDGVENKKKKVTEQASLKEKAVKINEGQHIKGYLIIPDSSPEETTEEYKTYKKKWAKMRKTVGNFIPALTDNGDENDPGYHANPNWKTIKYTPLGNQNRELRDGPRGMLLFKYDPDHEGKKKAALWVEDDKTDQHNDTW